MKTGVVHVDTFGGSELSVLGIGRVGPPVGETETTKAKYIQPYEQDRVLAIGEEQFDVLITHDARREFIRSGIGMDEINVVLDDYKPLYHFFGHTGDPFLRQIDSNGVTVCSKLSDFEWEEDDPGKPLKDGCFGLLRWNGPGDHTFEVISEPWIREYTAYTWKYL